MWIHGRYIQANISLCYVGVGVCGECISCETGRPARVVVPSSHLFDCIMSILLASLTSWLELQQASEVIPVRREVVRAVRHAQYASRQDDSSFLLEHKEAYNVVPSGQAV